jgi:hypothetical protein
MLLGRWPPASTWPAPSQPVSCNRLCSSSALTGLVFKEGSTSATTLCAVMDGLMNELVSWISYTFLCSLYAFSLWIISSLSAILNSLRVYCILSPLSACGCTLFQCCNGFLCSSIDFWQPVSVSWSCYLRLFLSLDCFSSPPTFWSYATGASGALLLIMMCIVMWCSSSRGMIY